MSAPDLCYLSALEALAAFRSGELSPLDYLEALIARIGTSTDEAIVPVEADADH